jgi:hypothetical protein
MNRNFSSPRHSGFVVDWPIVPKVRDIIIRGNPNGRPEKRPSGAKPDAFENQEIAPLLEPRTQHRGKPNENAQVANKQWVIADFYQISQPQWIAAGVAPKIRSLAQK